MAETSGTTLLPVKPKADPRLRIVEALMQLCGERRFEEITIRDITARANLSLADFRDTFPSKAAALAGLNRILDRAVLDQNFDEMTKETQRERLFDVLMRRLEAMAPYRNGLREVVAWLKRDPLSASQMNRAVVNSMRFMLEAAGVDNEGPTAALKLQGLALVWTQIVAVWLDDDDPGLTRTMAEVDRELSRGEQLVARVNQLDGLAAPFRRLAGVALQAGERLVERRRTRDETSAPNND